MLLTRYCTKTNINIKTKHKDFRQMDMYMEAVRRGAFKHYFLVLLELELKQNGTMQILCSSVHLLSAFVCLIHGLLKQFMKKYM